MNTGATLLQPELFRLYTVPGWRYCRLPHGDEWLTEKRFGVIIQVLLLFRRSQLMGIHCFLLALMPLYIIGLVAMKYRYRTRP